MENFRNKIWENSGLPKPFLGRGRSKQLKSLDKDTIEKQNIIKKFINREAAKNARLKKKQKELNLIMENENLKKENNKLKEENENLKNIKIDTIRLKILQEEVYNLQIENNDLYRELLRFNCFLN